MDQGLTYCGLPQDNEEADHQDDLYTEAFLSGERLSSDCICYDCATAGHNGGDDDCACNANPWWEERCTGCKHRERCDVALHPEAYPFWVRTRSATHGANRR